MGSLPPNHSQDVESNLEGVTATGHIHPTRTLFHKSMQFAKASFEAHGPYVVRSPVRKHVYTASTPGRWKGCKGTADRVCGVHFTRELLIDTVHAFLCGTVHSHLDRPDAHDFRTNDRKRLLCCRGGRVRQQVHEGW